MKAARPLLPGVAFCADPYEAARDADAVALITDWAEFKAVDLARVSRTLRRAILIDGRNLYDSEAMAAFGFAYHGMGVPAAEEIASWHVDQGEEIAIIARTFPARRLRELGEQLVAD
jgi:hypothetical protein